MRLIDADALIEEIKDNEFAWLKNKIQCLSLIKRQPTAFNVEKVVEQLEEEREYSYADFEEYVQECSPCLDAEYDDYFHRGLERAVKIVKGSGLNE